MLSVEWSLCKTFDWWKTKPIWMWCAEVVVHGCIGLSQVGTLCYGIFASTVLYDVFVCAVRVRVGVFKRERERESESII